MSTVSIVGGAPSGSGSSIVAPPGGRGGNGAIDVEEAGVPVVAAATKLNFVGNATVTNGGGGSADIAIISGDGIAVFNVKDYGATGNGTTDDTLAIRLALAACESNGGGTVYFPNGTYIISQNGASGAFCLDIPENTTLLGESISGAIIKMAGGQAAFVRPIMIQTANVCLSVLTIDGNKSAQISDDEHRAGIFLLNAFYTVLEDLIVQNNTGDGIDLSISTWCVIQRCNLQDNDRNGVTWNTTTLYTSVRDCNVTGNSGQLHVEADSGDTLCQYIWIDNCYLGVPGPASAALSTSSITFDVHVRNCYIDGPVGLAQASRCTIDSCYITTSDAGGPSPLAIDVGCSNILVTNCTIVQNVTQAGAPQIVSIAGNSTLGQPNGIVIENNQISSVGTNAAGFDIRDCNNVIVKNNTITGAGVSNGLNGFQIFATDTTQPAPTLTGISVIGNQLNNWAVGIFAGIADAGCTIGTLTFNGNLFSVPTGSDEASGIFLSAANGGPMQVACIDNDQENLPTMFGSYPACPLLTGGNRGGGGVYNCAGTPNGQIAETIGAMAMQRDGAGGVVGWIKTSRTDDTGWQSINVT